MKFAILFLIVLLNFSCEGQNKLDSLVFYQVNSYRDSKKLNLVKFKDTNFKAANQHSLYLMKSNKIGHDEDSLSLPIDRFRFHGGVSNYISENVVHLNLNVKNDSIDYTQISKEIVNMLINSSEHNKNLSDNKFNFLGISCVLIYKPTGIMYWSNIEVISTLFLSN